MKTIRLTKDELVNLDDNPCIYQLRNILTDYVLISSTERFKTHLKTLLHAIENKYDRIPEKLVNDFENYGSEYFVIDILKRDEVNKENMSELKDQFIESESRLYNIKKHSNGGGFEVVANESYVLDLDGNIVSEHPSIQTAYHSLDSAPHYGGVNTSAKVRKKFRIVTKAFYESNLEEIKSWNNYNDYAEYRSKIYKESIKVKLTFNKKEKLFNSANDVAEFLQCSKETIRLILNGKTKSNPYNIQFANPEAIQLLQELKESEQDKKILELA